MNKFKQIRPIVLGVITKDNKILVNEGYDEVKKQKFYRCLGGGIEFQETSKQALKREFLEEIDKEIIIKDFLGLTENIFTFNGQAGHEIVLFYSADFKPSDYQEEYLMIEDYKKPEKAFWINIDEFKNGTSIIYPTDVLKYI